MECLKLLVFTVMTSQESRLLSPLAHGSAATGPFAGGRLHVLSTSRCKKQRLTDPSGTQRARSRSQKSSPVELLVKFEYSCFTSLVNPTRLFILGALARRGPMYGHQLRRDARLDRTEMWSDVRPGSLYGALHRLAAEALSNHCGPSRMAGSQHAPFTPSPMRAAASCGYSVRRRGRRSGTGPTQSTSPWP